MAEFSHSRAGRRHVQSSIRSACDHLAEMVMPNTGAFVAWGLISVTYTAAGWFPDATVARLIGPIETFLLPLLIGYSGGRLVHGQRGGVVGAVATIGVVVGADIPMFLGAMIVGPAGGYVIKQFDKRVGAKVKSDFASLVDNFSAGIAGATLATAGTIAIGPAVQRVTETLGTGVDTLIAHHLLPLVSLIIEPAKVLFFNNVINNGVLLPLGVQEAAAHGAAIHFLLETNPGPGLGILAACSWLGPISTRRTAFPAIVVQFIGGIHEVYFPYILASPRLILAAIAGATCGTVTFASTGAGLVGPPVPASIISILTLAPDGRHLGVLAGIAASAGVSFAVAVPLLKLDYRDGRNRAPFPSGCGRRSRPYRKPIAHDDGGGSR